MKISIMVLLLITYSVLGIQRDVIELVRDYFLHKNVKYICYLSCENQFNNIIIMKAFTQSNIKTAILRVDQRVTDIEIKQSLRQWKVDVGVILDGSCDNAIRILEQASEMELFDAMHVWLVLTPHGDNLTQFIDEYFQNLNLSIDADLAVVSYNESSYTFTDVFNFGKIQGNSLEIASLGSWRPDSGLEISLKGFKYYHRWDFHNLTLRAISVILDRPEVFRPEMLSDIGYTSGIAAMTKITSQLLNLLKEQHNFRFRYTVSDRWIGSPRRNSTLAVTNSLYWGEQDISSTCARIFPRWLDWVDICFPPTTNLQTKFYYLIADKGVGAYENRFLTPLSLGVWWCTMGACVLCTAVLAIAARLERRPKPGLYAFFSVSAALFQQDFDDGEQEERHSSQAYAYHTEPYTASQVISKTFREGELCELGELQMMLPAPVYIMVQKRSPYREFFVWSLMCLSERGHVQASRSRFSGAMPACSGARPRALALGQAAPAFLVLLQLTVVSVLILVVELVWHRIHTRP